MTQPSTLGYQRPLPPPPGLKSAIARRSIALVTGVLCCVYAIVLLVAAHVLSRLSMSGNYYRIGLNFITFFWTSFAFTGLALFIYGLLSDDRQHRFRLLACTLTLLQLILASGVCLLMTVALLLYYVVPQLPMLVVLLVCFITLAKTRAPNQNPYDMTFGRFIRRIWDKLCGY